jgi:cysteine synthase
VVRIAAPAAVSYCHELVERHGLAVGGSSGAAIAAAVSWLQNAGRPLSAVCICPDHGDLYLGSIFKHRSATSPPARIRTQPLVYQP